MSPLRLAARILPIATITVALGLAGCANNTLNSPGGTGTGGTGLTAGGASVLYAVQQPSVSGTSILEFSLASGSGTLSPIATLLPPSGVSFNAVATDSSGQIYAGAYIIATGQGEVLVYPANSTGQVTPTRTILGGLFSSTTTFAQPQSMHVSSAGTLAILSYNGAGYSVATMPSTATGTVTPTTLIQGSATQMTGVQCVTIDQNGKVYVTNYNGTGSILEFASGATGNAAPATVITAGSAAPYGAAADSSGNVFTVLDNASGTAAGSIDVYASGASGAATPTRIISGSSTGIYFGGGLRLDTVGNLYMINETANNTYSIVAFPQSSSGNSGPGLTFSSTALTSPAAEIAVR